MWYNGVGRNVRTIIKRDVPDIILVFRKVWVKVKVLNHAVMQTFSLSALSAILVFMSLLVTEQF